MNKLSYELAKKLKDAGFPQKEVNTYTGKIIHPTSDIDGSLIDGLLVDEMIYIPTLPELIEACGKIHLISPNMSLDCCDGIDKWEASSDIINIYSETYPKEKEMPLGMETKEGRGSTPEEAVANLWLELNK